MPEWWQDLTGRASSSPTGMGVSTCTSRIALRSSAVRPRHRRGWESQLRVSERGKRIARRCVLVTDGDGSLNSIAGTYAIG